MDENRYDDNYEEDERNEEEHSKKKRKYNKSFYVVFALCLCAIGAAAWYSYGDVTNYMEDNTTSTAAETTPQEQNAEAKVQGVTEPTLGSENLVISTEPASPTNASSYTEEETDAETPTEKLEDVVAQENSEKLIFPVSETVTKKWSGDTPVYFETLKDWRTHQGADFKCNDNASVKSAGSGNVKEITESGLYGPTIIIEQNDGAVLTYCGVKADENLSVGSHVSSGDNIGTAVKIPCEANEETHIHLEVNADGKKVDPVEYLNNN